MKVITYSFVIPHHNTPDLLQRLVDSIPQREDIEIIVVDDNSDDDKKASVIRSDVKTIFIDKEHTKGAGGARNIGMDAAVGRWLLFADADDFYKPNFINVLDEYKDDDIEILFFNVDSVNSDTLEDLSGTRYNRAFLVQHIVSAYDGSCQKADELKYLSYGPWRKMLSMSYIRKYNFYYETISRGNDVFFSLQTSYFVKKFKVEKRILYTNTRLEGSIVYSKTTKQKYADNINRLLHISRFFKYIGHQDWNISSIRGKRTTSYHKYLLILLIKEPVTGIAAYFYWLTHLFDIYRNANYYVDVIKRIEHNQKLCK